MECEGLSFSGLKKKRERERERFTLTLPTFCISTQPAFNTHLKHNLHDSKCLTERDCVIHDPAQPTTDRPTAKSVVVVVVYIYLELELVPIIKCSLHLASYIMCLNSK